MQRSTLFPFLSIGLLVGILFHVIESQTYSSILLLSTIIVVLSLVTMAVEFRSNSDVFSPIFWILPSFIIVYVVPAIKRAVNQDFTFTGRYLSQAPPPTLIERALIFALVGLIGLSLGYYSQIGKKLAKSMPHLPNGWSSTRSWRVVIGYVVIGVISYVFLYSHVGDGPRSQLASGSTMLPFIGINLLNSASILILANISINYIEYEDYRAYIIGRRYPLLLSAVMILISVRLLWTLGGRGRAFQVFAVSLFVLHYLVKEFNIKLYIIFIIILKVAPAWVASMVAALITADIEDMYYHTNNIVLFGDSPTNAFNQFVLLIGGVPEHLNYKWGTTFLSAPFDLIPGQPFLPTDVVYNQVFAPWAVNKFGYPITLIGELYLNFSFIGMVIGMIIAGILIRSFYEWSIVGERTSYASIILFAAMMNSYLLFGNFSNSAPGTGLRILPIIIALIYITRGGT